jgi:hypothetical protein
MLVVAALCCAVRHCTLGPSRQKKNGEEGNKQHTKEQQSGGVTAAAAARNRIWYGMKTITTTNKQHTPRKSSNPFHIITSHALRKLQSLPVQPTKPHSPTEPSIYPSTDQVHPSSHPSITFLQPVYTHSVPFRPSRPQRAGGLSKELYVLSYCRGRER